MDLKHPQTYNLPTLTMVIERPKINQVVVNRARKYGKHTLVKQVNNI